jgi:hypothetical protein
MFRFIIHFLIQSEVFKSPLIWKLKAKYPWVYNEKYKLLKSSMLKTIKFFLIYNKLFVLLQKKKYSKFLKINLVCSPSLKLLNKITVVGIINVDWMICMSFTVFKRLILPYGYTQNKIKFVP